MHDTFLRCSNLAKASKIPSSVTFINRVYSECPKLQGTIEIDANVNGQMIELTDKREYLDYGKALIKSTEGDLKLIVTGSCPMLNQIVEEAKNPNITLKK